MSPSGFLAWEAHNVYSIAMDQCSSSLIFTLDMERGRVSYSRENRTRGITLKNYIVGHVILNSHVLSYISGLGRKGLNIGDAFSAYSDTEIMIVIRLIITK